MNYTRKVKKRNVWSSIALICTILGTFLAVIVLVFQLGHYFGSKNSKEEAFKNFSEYLDRIKSDVQIVGLNCNKKVLIPGELVELYIDIENKSLFELNLWIGASAIGKKSKREIWNKLQDRIVTISASGMTSTKRYLTFPNDTKSEYFDLIVNLWYGKIGDPNQSVIISSASLLNQLEVK